MPKNVSFGTKEISFNISTDCMLPAQEARHV